MRRARNTIIWPWIAKDVKQLADNCEICQESKPRNCRETLKQHDNGAYPWNKIGLDIFEIKGRNYLIAVDYYSNFIEVDYLPTMTSSQMIGILKKHFARYGIPSIVMSDNGPQFVSREFELFLSNWKVNHATSSPGHNSQTEKPKLPWKSLRLWWRKQSRMGPISSKRY